MKDPQSLPKDPTTENNPGKGTSKKEKTFKWKRFQKGTKKR
jgi:hypothetical protein